MALLTKTAVNSVSFSFYSWISSSRLYLTWCWPSRSPSVCLSPIFFSFCPQWTKTPTLTRRRTRRRRRRRTKKEMKTDPNPCLPTAPASSCPPPTREYLRPCVKKKPRPNTVIKHLLCPYWGRRRVIESEAWKCLNSFVVCAVFFHVSTHVCVRVFAPGFASAVTTSWLWSISSSASCPSSPWAASPSLQRTPSGLTHREIMWDIIHCVCVGGNKMFPEDIKMRKNLPKRKHVTNFRKYDGWFRMRLWFWLF